MCTFFKDVKTILCFKGLSSIKFFLFRKCSILNSLADVKFKRKFIWYFLEYFLIEYYHIQNILDVKNYHMQVCTSQNPKS